MSDPGFIAPAKPVIGEEEIDAAVRVLRSGAPEKKGEWVEERVNVRDDYKKFFDTKETPKPAGIAVLTDADDTSSTAQGDYANFRVCRQ